MRWRTTKDAGTLARRTTGSVASKNLRTVSVAKSADTVVGPWRNTSS